MVERLRAYPTRLRTLKQTEIDGINQQQSLIPETAPIAQQNQIKRMIDLFAGNVAAIQVQFRTHEALESLAINQARVTISPATQDEESLKNRLGNGVAPLFNTKQPPISYPITHESNLIIGIDGRILQVGNKLTTETNAPTFLTALEQATGLSRERIIHISEIVSSVRRNPEQLEEDMQEIGLETQDIAPLPGIQSRPIDMTDLVSRLDIYLQQDTEGQDKPLYPHQRDMIGAIQDSFENGQARMSVISATGSGKTKVMTEVAKAANVPTIIVVPTRIVMEQTLSQLTDAGIDAGAYYENQKDTFAGGNTVIVTTYASFSGENFAIQPAEARLILFDEAHMILGKGVRQQIAHFDQTVQIGFTASPDFSTFKTIRNFLPPIFERGVQEYVEDGYLSPFAVWIAQTALDLSTVTINNSAGGFNERELADAVGRTSMSETAVELYQKEFNTKSAIAYCVGVEHARHTAEVFKSQGISAEYISGQTPKEERREILARFKTGKTTVLCNADILTVGFDEPRAEVCLNLRPVRSLVIATQRAGRVLRLNPNDPEKFAIIVDFFPEKIKGTPPISYADIVGHARILPAGELMDDDPLRTIRRTYRDTTGHIVLGTSGTTIITDTTEVMRFIGKFSEFLEPREGELPITYLAENLGIPYVILMQRLSRYVFDFINEDPTRIVEDAVRMRQTEQGGILKFYSLEFVTFLQNKFQVDKTALFMTVKEIADIVGITVNTATNLITTLLSQSAKPEELATTIYDRRGNKRIGYSPDLFIHVINRYANMPILSGDSTDLSLHQAGRRLGLDLRVVKTAMQDMYGPSYEELGFFARTVRSKITQYYPEEIILPVIEKLREKRGAEASSGWMTAQEIQAQLREAGVGINIDDLRTKLTIVYQQLREDDDSLPEQNTFFNPHSHKTQPFYPPESIDVISQSSAIAPEGWLSMPGIQRALQERGLTSSKPVLNRRIRELYEEMRQADSILPEDNRFDVPGAHVQAGKLFFPPQIIETLAVELQQAGKTPIPENWVSATSILEIIVQTGLITKLGSVSKAAQAIYVQLQQLDPTLPSVNNFPNPGNKNRPQAYYPLQVIQLVKEQLEGVPIPEEWISSSDLISILRQRGITSHDAVIRKKARNAYTQMRKANSSLPESNVFKSIEGRRVPSAYFPPEIIEEFFK